MLFIVKRASVGLLGIRLPIPPPLKIKVASLMVIEKDSALTGKSMVDILKSVPVIDGDVMIPDSALLNKASSLVPGGPVSGIQFPAAPKLLEVVPSQTYVAALRESVQKIAGTANNFVFSIKTP